MVEVETTTEGVEIPLEKSPVDSTKSFNKKPNEDAAGKPYLPDQMDQAVADFDQESGLSHLHTEMNTALLKFQRNDYESAQKSLRHILMQDPSFTDAIKWSGIVFKHQGKYKQATQCFRTLVKKRPSEFTFQLLAEVLYIQNEDQEALEWYSKALARISDTSPVLFEIYKNLGNIHVRSGDFDAAEEFYNKAFTLNDKSDALFVNYGTLEWQRQNFEKAKDRFRTAIRINGMNDKAWVGLALVHRQFGDFELAWGNLKMAMDVNHANKTALQLCVQWGVNDYSYDVPVSRLQDYLRDNEEDTEMSFLLAQVFLLMGRLNEAKAEMEKVMSWMPEMPGAVELYERIKTRIRGEK